MLAGYSVFIFVIILLLVSWSLVTFWQRFLENLFFRTFEFDSDNTLATLLVAVISTIVFLLLVWVIKVMDLIPNIDTLLFDYSTTEIGGNISTLTSRQGGRTIGGKVSPRAALFA